MRCQLRPAQASCEAVDQSVDTHAVTTKFDERHRQCIRVVMLLRQVVDKDISMAVDAHRCPWASSKMNLYFFNPVDSANCSTMAHVMIHDLHGACNWSANLGTYVNGTSL